VNTTTSSGSHGNYQRTLFILDLEFDQELELPALLA